MMVGLMVGEKIGLIVETMVRAIVGVMVGTVLGLVLGQFWRRFLRQCFAYFFKLCKQWIKVPTILFFTDEIISEKSELAKSFVNLLKMISYEIAVVKKFA